MRPDEILQPGRGALRGDHYLPATGGNVLWGRLPCAADAPVLEVDTGALVTFDTLSHEGVLDDQGSDPVAFFGAHGVPRELVLDDAVALTRERTRGATDGPHVITGPVRVRGARVGDLLRMTVVETLPRVPYGVISSRHGRGSLRGEHPATPGTVSVFARVDGEHGTLPRTWGGPHDVRFPLRPFLGIMGVATAGTTRAHSVPPGPHGGNIDIALLTAGASLLLPVQVDGALAYVGDPHFAQGDGEVALTAMEASLRATVRLDVVPAEEARRLYGAIRGPLVETDDLLVPTGQDEDLDEAVRDCVRAAVDLLGARYGMDPALAYAYLSAAVDVRISQVVDIVQGAHATIRKSDFA
ncbi:acetamidase/formamidase family protein [Clavibacter sp. km1a]|uniref:acetamidase/formamidase family protein n=1 Tax=Clavibacter sp. km1a TaxID=3459136 RepID=UPI004041E0FC